MNEYVIVVAKLRRDEWNISIFMNEEAPNKRGEKIVIFLCDVFYNKKVNRVYMRKRILIN